MDIVDRIRGGLFGVLVGDALGVPHEFKSMTASRSLTIEMVMPPDYPKTYPRVPYGTWSDDGSLTLALAASLGHVGYLDEADFGKRIVAWFTHGEYTPDAHTYDVGNTTQEAILRMMRGHEARVAGLTDERSNGNGSLMRTLPMALFHMGSDQELYNDACRASAVTHGHDVSKAACGVYSIAARHLLNGATPARAFIEGLKLAHVPLDIPKKPGGSGYVLDSLAFAIQAVRTGAPYDIIVQSAIALGGDTDTTAAIAGGLIGCRDGVAAIPERWLKALRGRDQAEKIVSGLIKKRGL